MDKNDVDTINRSLPTLTRTLDLNQRFLSLLKDYRIFSDEMINDILRNENPKLEMCLMLIRRGPNAYKNFVKALVETNQTATFQHLEEVRSKYGFPPSIILPQSSENPGVINNNDDSIRDFPHASAQPVPASLNNAEYRRKVLDPPNYIETPLSPTVQIPSTVTDSFPPDYNILNIQVKIGTEIRGLGQDIYPNRNIKPRGQALILNYEQFTNLGQRIGSEKDVIHLDQLLQQLGYNVTLKTNLNLVDTYTELDLFAKYEEHNQADSTIIAMMSHGKGGSHADGTLIFTSDGRFIPSEDVLSRFNNKSCPLLKGKPKIFLFQFCRGDNIDHGFRSMPEASLVQSGGTVTDGNPLPSSPVDFERSYEDMLIAYSTLPGYVSYREESEGTWFIKALCLIFMEEAHFYHIDRLLQRVDELVKCWTGKNNGKQTLEVTRRGFNKKFYFNPGLWKVQQ